MQTTLDELEPILGKRNKKVRVTESSKQVNRRK